MTDACTVLKALSSSFAGYGPPQVPPQQSTGELNVDFESVFGNKAASSNNLDTNGIVHLTVFTHCTITERVHLCDCAFICTSEKSDILFGQVT